MRTRSPRLTLPEHPNLRFDERPQLTSQYDSDFMIGRIQRLVEAYANPLPFDFKHRLLLPQRVPDTRLVGDEMVVTARFDNWDRDSAMLELWSPNEDRVSNHVAVFNAALKPSEETVEKLGSPAISLTLFDKAARNAENHPEPFKAEVPATLPEMVLALNYLAVSCGESPIIIPESKQVAALESMGFVLSAGNLAVSHA